LPHSVLEGRSKKTGLGSSSNPQKLPSDFIKTKKEEASHAFGPPSEVARSLWVYDLRGKVPNLALGLSSKKLKPQVPNQILQGFFYKKGI
jgi:hypothetical protein